MQIAGESATMDVLSFLAGLVILLVLVVAYFLLRAQMRYRYKFGAPGPAPHLFWGNVFSLRDEFGPYQRHVMVKEYHKRYGVTFVMHVPLGLKALVYTRDPAIARAMIKNSEDFPTRNEESLGFSMFIPEGLLGDIKGEQWKMHRRALSPLFSDRYLRWYTTAVNEQLRELQAFLRDKADSYVDLQLVLTLFTLDVIGRVGFGTRFQALKNPNNPFVHAGKDMLGAVIAVQPRWFPGGEVRRKGWEGKRALDTLIDSILDRKASDLEDDEAKMNMLRAMQETVDPQSGRKLSRTEIRDEIHTLLGAGHETTANTATWALHLLANHPEVFARVREEIDAVKPTDALSRGQFEFDQIHSFTFTKRVVFETLRLFPTVPMFPRLAARDLELKKQDGHSLFLPKGTMIFTSTVQFLDGDLREPTAFRPDRFDPASPLFDSAVEDKSKFMPFGGGGRICLGQRFAEMEAVQMLAAVVAQFDLVPDPQRPPQEYCDITLGPKESGLWMKIIPRPFSIAE